MVPGAGLWAVVNQSVHLLVILILSQNWDPKYYMPGSMKCLPSIFSLFLSDGGRNEFNQKIPMFFPNDAIISSQNQDDLFGISNNRHESTQRLQS